MSVELKKLIEANPLFSDKLQFPNLKRSRLWTFINQGLNWQHGLCKSPSPNPLIKTLYVDHPCGQPNCARAPSPANNPLLGIKQGAVKILSLIGTNVGDVGLWEVGSRERLVVRNFKVWDLSSCSMLLQAAVVKDPVLSVNHVIRSPDGALFGIAYSRYIVQIYSYHGGDDVREHLEIDAHVGGVNDLAFSHPNEQLCVITCGDDKTIKVWDATTGAKQYTFEGQEAPVYSVCPHHKENIQFIFSIALDGKIKAWEYDNLGSRVDYDAPGRWSTTMAYSADGTRLFSCGTSKDGESYIVEWNESEGAVKRTYQGFRKRSFGVVQFNTTKNRFFTAGDDFSIKFWDMDNIQLLTTADADGGLPVGKPSYPPQQGWHSLGCFCQ
ncbi:protein TPR3-like isoform X2 [Pyrus communis]|uniref:protein TPR3-like isoform X2 n=1 Tax=Pyrus communis TaxID=23211 RepID=UPI0035C26CD5